MSQFDEFTYDDVSRVAVVAVQQVEFGDGSRNIYLSVEDCHARLDASTARAIAHKLYELADEAEK